MNYLTLEQRRWMAKEAKLKRLTRKCAAQAILLRECDIVLTMVPATSKPDSWMGLLQSDFVAPLLKKLRS